MKVNPTEEPDKLKEKDTPSKATGKNSANLTSKVSPSRGAKISRD